MDLTPTFEQQHLRESLRRLLDRRLAELVDGLPEPPQHSREQALADADAVGLLTLGLPEKVGGAGTFADLAVAHEELGRGLAAPLLTTLTLAGRLVLRAALDGGPLLEELATGRRTATPALTDVGDPLGAPATTVSDDGDSVRVDGRKARVVNGRDVDELLVSARDGRTGDVVLVRVPADHHDLEWVDEVQRCDVPHAGVVLREIVLPATARLAAGEEHGLAAFRTDATVLAAARQVGGGRAALDRTIAHVRGREQFGRPIGTFQSVQHQLADVATDLDAAALAVAQAAWAIDAGLPAAVADRHAAVAALAAGAAFQRTTLVAHQLHGGMGFVLDSPLHLWSARAVADPTTPSPRRHLLDRLAAATGITAEGVAVPDDHRAAAPR